MRAQRLEAARSPSAAPVPALVAVDGTAPQAHVAAMTKTTGGLKRDASSRAQGARRQAHRDAR